ncbi:MAG: DUF2277 domain-containing protein [Acidobacteria bacterium]|nr:DUF2277 domain-containing protein [Acidobacteriota bacterium]MBI3471595.1 DUF2277 domain-containing protein [Candidatus Solibacter usitatus]
MCRSIKVLRRPAQPATADEISAASLQFVRKVSGFRQPSKANQPAFDAAVREIAGSVDRLLGKIRDHVRSSSSPVPE